MNVNFSVLNYLEFRNQDLATLNSSISKNCFYDIYQILNQLDRNELRFSQQSNQQQKIYLILKSLKKCWLIKFVLQYQDTQIIKDLSKISFFQLKQLDLSFNKIDSIEPIGYLQTPQLKRLKITNNDIVSLKPLSKFHHTKNLTHLFLYNNKLGNKQCWSRHFSRVFLSNKNRDSKKQQNTELNLETNKHLYKLLLQSKFDYLGVKYFSSSNKQKTQVEDIRYLIKSQPQMIQNIKLPKNQLKQVLTYFQESEQYQTNYGFKSTCLKGQDRYRHIRETTRIDQPRIYTFMQKQRFVQESQYIVQNNTEQNVKQNNNKNVKKTHVKFLQTRDNYEYSNE